MGKQEKCVILLITASLTGRNYHSSISGRTLELALILKRALHRVIKLRFSNWARFNSREGASEQGLHCCSENGGNFFCSSLLRIGQATGVLQGVFCQGWEVFFLNAQNLQACWNINASRQSFD